MSQNEEDERRRQFEQEGEALLIKGRVTKLEHEQEESKKRDEEYKERQILYTKKSGLVHARFGSHESRDERYISGYVLHRKKERRVRQNRCKCLGTSILYSCQGSEGQRNILRSNPVSDESPDSRSAGIREYRTQGNGTLQPPMVDCRNQAR